MTALTALMDDVYTLTNRPDLVAETELAVKAATLKMHQSDFYAKDLYETAVQFDTADYVQSLAYRQLVPRWRAAKYIRKYEVAQGNNATGKFLRILTPDQVLDSYGQNRADIAYVAGDTIEIRSLTQLQYVLLGCYVNPDVTTNGYSSWIAIEHPYAIVYEAARTVFKQIGYDEQSAQFERLVQEQLVELKMAQLPTVGY